MKSLCCCGKVLNFDLLTLPICLLSAAEGDSEYSVQLKSNDNLPNSWQLLLKNISSPQAKVLDCVGLQTADVWDIF